MLPEKLVLELALAAFQAVQSIHDALTLLVPTLTSFENGTIATWTSPEFVAAACNVVSRLCVAVFRAVILPYSIMDPVLSKASATCSLLVPQDTIELPVTVSCLKPMTPMTFVFINAVPLTVSGLACLSQLTLMLILVASGRVNKALK